METIIIVLWVLYVAIGLIHFIKYFWFESDYFSIYSEVHSKNQYPIQHLFFAVLLGVFYPFKYVSDLLDMTHSFIEKIWNYRG